MKSPDREYTKWLKWEGDKRWPAAPNNMGVRIRQRCGQEFDTEFPHSWNGWVHNGGPSDITHYCYWWKI